VLNTCLDETKSHHATLEQLEQSLTQTTENITDFINTHGSTNSFLDKLNTLEQKLRTIENAKSYVKALLVASELR
jgi:phage-related protein